ncbi:cation:proton antiporter [Frankia sp. AgPm24]|uniref:cation:proton antiporter n=1 Tax=Frankia sp. AgPm24 TaxID=631128 RepID=UPI00200F01B4|nr:cation:proton antiporter [Frankia sp. AgPm24]MCK9924684.1 cation:proton antiporter [Frankia sp. AgPm24]
MESAVAVVAVTLMAYALVERRLRQTPISGALVFTAAGLLASDQVSGLITSSVGEHGVTAVLELTLVIVLFTDAMGAGLGPWATESPLPGRLLGIGFPLTIAVGWLLASVLFPGLDRWETALLAAILAPTDLALGLPVINNRRVPRLIRHALNVEGGLNDGLALPFVTIFLALALEEENTVGNGHAVSVFLRALLASGAIGMALGAGGALTLRWSARRGWSSRLWQSLALLAMATLAYVLADLIDGSGFIAAWAAGLVTGLVGRESLAAAQQTPQDVAQLGVSVSLVLFGALLLAPALAHATWTAFGYGLLSLTVIRMIPVAVSLGGSKVAPPTVAYVGWFGPRGLASIVFADLVATSGLPEQHQIVTVVMLTVGMSVVLHGLTAPWGARRYGRWYEAAAARHPGIREAAEAPPPDRLAIPPVPPVPPTGR